MKETITIKRVVYQGITHWFLGDSNIPIKDNLLNSYLNNGWIVISQSNEAYTLQKEDKQLLCD